ncbi:MAG TPA: phage holin family protein [Chitinophagaceae bacterium]
MGIFNTIGSTLNDLRNSAMEFIETQIALAKVQAAEKVSTLVSTIAAFLILSVFLLFFLLFGSIAAAYWMASITGSNALGFLIVGGFYLLVGVIIFLGRERLLRRPMLNAIIRQLFKERTAEGKEEHKEKNESQAN